MATVVFIGDAHGGSNPAVCVMFGIEFPYGAPVKVDDDAILRKLRGNSHFEVGGEKRTRKRRTEPDQSESECDSEPDLINGDTNAE